MRKVLSVILCVSMLCFCVMVPISAETGVPDTEMSNETKLSDGFMLITESDKLALYVNTDTANIAIFDKRTQKTWSAFSEALSSSDSRTSMLNVTYLGNNSISMEMGTHDAMIGFDVLKLKDGIKEIFYFEAESLTCEIPIKVILKDDYVEITLLYKDIKEEGAGKICDISLLPNWGEGVYGDDGYILIPDGSGAVIEYKDIDSRFDTYSARIYGDDLSQDLIYSVPSDSEKARLPVFGIKQGNSAVFSVITVGEPFATVNSEIGNNIATVYSKFVYRETDITGIQENGGGTRTMTISQNKPVSVEPCIRQYYLANDEATYSGMANKYRSHLESQGVLKNKTRKVTPAVSFEAFGSVTEKKSFLGIPYDSDLTVTTFEQLFELNKKLKANDIENASFYLYGFLKGGFEGGITTKPSYIRKLGGQKGYDKFLSNAGKENVYTVYNISRTFDNKFALFTSNSFTKNLGQTTVEQHYRILSSGMWNTDFGLWKFYNIEKQKDNFTKLFKKLSSKDGIVLEQTGEELYSDFNIKESTSRNDYLYFLNQMFKKCSDKKIPLAYENGNAYCAKYASEMYEIPLTSSGYSIESYTVPFYTMVFHGYIPLSSKAVNDSSDMVEYKLKAFEQGVSALWRITGIDTYEIKDTKLNFLYNSKIESVFDSAVSLAEDYNEVHSVLFDKCILNHEYNNGLSITTYENGWKIVCNYSDETVMYNGTKVSSTDYAIIR